MDYLNIYNSNYTKAYRTGESFIKHKLILFNRETLSFGRASNLILESFENFEKKISINNVPELKELKHIYKKSLSNYSKKNIELALKNDVKKGFSKLSLDNININYTLESFIKELAISNAINELLRLFNNYSDMFKMMYDNNYFDLFEIKDYCSIDFRDSKNYTDLLNRFYPIKKTSETYTESLLVNYSNDIINDLDNNTSYFNEKEKAFLLHSIYKIIEESKTSTKLNNTEFYKVLSIVNLKDNSCLVNDNYKNSDYYRILTGGLEKISSDIKSQDNFIDILISKTRPLKLKNITKYLSEKSIFLKASIARNSNKAK